MFSSQEEEVQIQSELEIDKLAKYLRNKFLSDVDDSSNVSHNAKLTLDIELIRELNGYSDELSVDELEHLIADCDDFVFTGMIIHRNEIKLTYLDRINSELRAENCTLIQENNSLSENIEQLNVDLDSKSQQLSINMGKLDAAREEIARSLCENNSLSAEKALIEEELNKLKRICGKFKSQIDEMRGKHTDAMQENKELLNIKDKQIEDGRKEIAALEKTNEDLRNKGDHELARLQEEMAVLKKINEKLQLEVDTETKEEQDHSDADNKIIASDENSLSSQFLNIIIQHRLEIAAFIIIAASTLVITALLLNPVTLPIAIAGVVLGLSPLAHSLVVGASIAVCWAGAGLGVYGMTHKQLPFFSTSIESKNSINIESEKSIMFNSLSNGCES